MEEMEQPTMMLLMLMLLLWFILICLCVLLCLLMGGLLDPLALCRGERPSLVFVLLFFVMVRDFRRCCRSAAIP